MTDSKESLIQKLEIVRLFVLSFPMHKHAPDTLRALSDIKQAIIRQHESKNHQNLNTPRKCVHEWFVNCWHGVVCKNCFVARNPPFLSPGEAL